MVAATIISKTTIVVVRVFIVFPLWFGDDTAASHRKAMTNKHLSVSLHLYFEFSFGVLFWASETIPLSPPRFMVSIAELGTMTRAPFSFRPSKSMFMALKCKAVGLWI